MDTPSHVSSSCLHINSYEKDGSLFCNDCPLDKCLHRNIFEDENGMDVCEDCGVEIEKFDFEPEWRYYYGKDNRSQRDPSRCRNKGKTENKSISKVFEEAGLEIPEAIMTQIKQRYQKVISNQDFQNKKSGTTEPSKGKEKPRGKGRKAIIAACWLHVYLKAGYHRTSDYIRNKFSLSKKDMSSGLTNYYIAFPEDRDIHTSAADLVEWIMTLTNVSKEHYKEIHLMVKYLESSSRLMKSSSPQSVASATVYFYLCLHPEYRQKIGVTKSNFAERVYLSEITITKLVTEAERIATEVE